jgi:hypothetical protein
MIKERIKKGKDGRHEKARKAASLLAFRAIFL